MTVQDLGSIGEIIGAVAVLFTLLYLSLQTRQARLAAEQTAKYAGLQATHSIINLYVDARRCLLEHAETIAKANSGQDLSDSEHYILSVVFHDLFYAASYSFTSAISSGSVHSEEGDIEYFTILLSDNACAIAQWHEMKGNVAKMDSGFVERVDAALAQSEK
ncbi:MAG: hypothetical protein ACI9JM_001586 [Halioglobus sp.]|jgi:hypothetical protein